MPLSKPTRDVIKAFAPTGQLRASINVGNPILASRLAATGEVIGVSVDLARGFAQFLGVEFTLQVFETAAESVAAVTSEAADIGFFAIDPARSDGICFTPPYLLIEGCYLVRHDSALTSNQQVDAQGHRVVVGQGSAYDLFLSRTLRHATIERAPSSPAVVSHFLEYSAEVAAGVRQQLEAEAAKRGGLRLLPDRFMVIQQAMACPRSRGPAAAALLIAYLETMKSQGVVARALTQHGVTGAAVAPAALTTQEATTA